MSAADAGPHLVVIAYMATGDPDDLTEKAAEAIAALPDPESGGVVALPPSRANRSLVNEMRRMNLGETARAFAAAFTPATNEEKH